MSKHAIITDGKIAAVVATATTSSGTGSWFGWIPQDVGLFAALMGAILSIVLIVVHIGKFILEYKLAKHQLKERNR